MMTSSTPERDMVDGDWTDEDSANTSSKLNGARRRSARPDEVKNASSVLSSLRDLEPTSSDASLLGDAFASLRRQIVDITVGIGRVAGLLAPRKRKQAWNSDVRAADVPHHILLRIAEYLYDPDEDSPSEDLLPGMALVCRSWSAAALEHLVRDLFLQGGPKQPWKMVCSLSGQRVKAPWDREGLEDGVLDSLFTGDSDQLDSSAPTLGSTESSLDSAPLHTIKNLDLTEIKNVDSEVLVCLLPYIRPRAMHTFRMAYSIFAHEAHIREFLSRTTELTDLGLVGLACNIEESFCAFVANNCKRITHLDWVAPEPAAEFFRSDHEPARYLLPFASLNLECLNLQDHPNLTDEVLAELVKTANWKLRALGVAGANLSSVGLDLICQQFPDLEDLDLTFLGGDNLVVINSGMLEKLLAMPNLKRLDMSCTAFAIDNRAIRLLLKSKLEYFGWDELPIVLRGKRRRREQLESKFFDRFAEGESGLQWGGAKGWVLEPAHDHEDGNPEDAYSVDGWESYSDGDDDDDSEMEESPWLEEDEEDEAGSDGPWSTEDEDDDEDGDGPPPLQQYNAM